MKLSPTLLLSFAVVSSFSLASPPPARAAETIVSAERSAIGTHHAVFRQNAGRDPFLPVGYVMPVKGPPPPPVPDFVRPNLTVTRVNAYIGQATLSTGETLKLNQSYQIGTTGARPPEFKILKINDESITILWNGQELEFQAEPGPTIEGLAPK